MQGEINLKEAEILRFQHVKIICPCGFVTCNGDAFELHQSDHCVYIYWAQGRAGWFRQSISSMSLQ